MSFLVLIAILEFSCIYDILLNIQSASIILTERAVSCNGMRHTRGVCLAERQAAKA